MTAQVNIAVNDREELIYLLTEAAQFEHVVMCTYLYAQWSLKKDEREGITPDEKDIINRWRASIRSIALEEMLHLALVNNLMAAFGAAPHFSRPDFPVRNGYFPSALDFHLAPFTEDTMQHFVFIERPEGIEVKDGAGFTHESHYRRVEDTDLLTPTARDYGSQGHLYHGIAQAIRRLATRLGEQNLFVGHGEAQLSSAEFPLPGLFEVSGVRTALKAIEEIVSQGEGAPAHREDSHYARFEAIREEYHALKQQRPDFEPAFPAAINPVLTEFADEQHTTRVTEPLARKVVDLGNAVYGLMLQTLAQVCAPAPLPSGLRQGLSDVSSQLMRYTSVIGEAAARMPACPDRPGVNAGLSFALPKSFGQLVQANAAQILSERAAELAGACHVIGRHRDLPGVAAGLQRLAEQLSAMHGEFEEHFTRVTDAGPSAAAAPQPTLAPDDVPGATGDDNTAASDEIELRFDVKRCIHSRRCVLNAPTVFLANVKGPWLHPETDTAEHLVHVAQSCPSGAITYRRLDGGPEEGAPQVNTIHLRQNGPYAFHASLDIEGQSPLYRATLCRCGQSRNKPFCDNSHIEAGFEATGEPATLPSEPLPERGGELHVIPLRDGPLKVRGPVEICSGTGRTINRTQYAKLCRCGGSANKPYCDDTHLKIGFRSGQDGGSKKQTGFK
jgi:CDGSH-type Zn-finger protein/uncharacterized Fe-S cluster protein YjdI